MNKYNKELKEACSNAFLSAQSIEHYASHYSAYCAAYSAAYSARYSLNSVRFASGYGASAIGVNGLNFVINKVLGVLDE